MAPQDPSSSATHTTRPDAGAERDPRPLLFTPRQILWCSVLLSPIAGAVLCALNHRALGRRRGLLMVIGVMAVFGIAITADERLSGDDGTFFTVSSAVALVFALAFHANSFATHIGIENRRTSLSAFGVSLLAIFALSVAVAIPLTIAEEYWPPANVSAGDRETVWYGSGATRDDAQHVIDVFTRLGVLKNEQDFQVELRRYAGDPLAVRAPYPNDAIANGNAAQWAAWAASALANAPELRECVRVDVIDERDTPRGSYAACPSAAD